MSAAGRSLLLVVLWRRKCAPVFRCGVSCVALSCYDRLIIYNTVCTINIENVLISISFSLSFGIGDSPFMNESI